jgi:hypothetical protein
MQMIIIFILVIVVGLYFVLSSKDYNNDEPMYDKSDYSQSYIIPMQNRENLRDNTNYNNTTRSTPCRPQPIAQPIVQPIPQPIAICNSSYNPSSVTPYNTPSTQYSNVPIITNYTYQRRPNPIIIDVIGGNNHSKKSTRTGNKKDSKIK